jgi:hypothetical protein
MSPAQRRGRATAGKANRRLAGCNVRGHYLVVPQTKRGGLDVRETRDTIGVAVLAIEGASCRMQLTTARVKVAARAA